METDLLAPLLLLLFDTNLYLQPQPGGGGRGGGGVQQWNAALQGCCMESDVTETAHFTQGKTELYLNSEFGHSNYFHWKIRANHLFLVYTIMNLKKT